MRKSPLELIERNLDRVRSRMREACIRAGRDPADARLVAVVKYARLEWVRELLRLGIFDLAESRPQQLLDRVELLPPSVNWHLIGHLQTNKVRKVLPLVREIHSVDSEHLWLSIRRIGRELGACPDLFWEVNVSGEHSKQGFSPQEIKDLWLRLDKDDRRHFVGLMTMAPNTGSRSDARRTFSDLKRLRDELTELTPESPLRELSMGMTGDFEIAIEEGASQVRIGSALFEGLE